MRIDRRIWQVQKCEGSKYTESILEFLLAEYIRIFGAGVMTTAPCIVYNDSTAKCPQFNHSQPLSIRLNQPSLSYWSQTIYQLSHELCHYAMYQTKQDKSFTLSWFEEIVCEAMSLYALQYSAQNWHKCGLSTSDPDYNKSILEYLNNEINRPALDGFMQCDTLDKLRIYESCELSENDRTSHIAERNTIYHAIVKDPTEAVCFLHYQMYIQHENGVAFDFDVWHKKERKNLILQLLGIFPVKSNKAEKDLIPST